MSTFLKLSFKLMLAVLVPAFFNALKADAQCNLNKTIKGDLITYVTPESYHYKRSKDQYSAVSIKTGLLKRKQTQTFYAEIEYTGKIIKTKPIKVAFGLADDRLISCVITFEKTKKNDNPTQNTGVYKVILDKTILADLRTVKLKDVYLIYKEPHRSVIIPIIDSSFLQLQLSCLEQQATE